MRYTYPFGCSAGARCLPGPPTTSSQLLRCTGPKSTCTTHIYTPTHTYDFAHNDDPIWRALFYVATVAFQPGSFPRAGLMRGATIRTIDTRGISQTNATHEAAYLKNTGSSSSTVAPATAAEVVPRRSSLRDRSTRRGSRIAIQTAS